MLVHATVKVPNRFENTAVIVDGNLHRFECSYRKYASLFTSRCGGLEFAGVLREL